jgi:hypothetical protein
LHQAVGAMVRRSSLARALAVRADDWFGYGKPDPARKWWLDLEDIEGNGILHVPESNKKPDAGFYGPEDSSGA